MSAEWTVNELLLINRMIGIFGGFVGLLFVFESVKIRFGAWICVPLINFDKKSGNVFFLMHRLKSVSKYPSAVISASLLVCFYIQYI